MELYVNQNDQELRKNFKNECRLIRLRREYPNYTGTVRSVILSELEHDEIMKKYGNLLADELPFVVWNTPVNQEWIQKSVRNERKFSYRINNLDIPFNDNILQDSFTLSHDFLEIEELKEKLRDVFRQLTIVQQERVVLHVFEGLSFEQIAVLEGRNKKSVYESYHAAIHKLRKILGNNFLTEN